MRRFLFEAINELHERNIVATQLVKQDPRAARPGPHGDHEAACNQQGHIAAFDDLDEIGAEENEINHQKGRHQRSRRPQGPAPVLPGHDEGEAGGDDHGSGDGDAIGGRQFIRRAEEHHDEQDADEQQLVHLGHVDLPLLRLRGMANVETGQQTQLDRLTRQRESARDHRLAGDDGGDRRQHHDGREGHRWIEAEEGVFQSRRIGEQQRPLPQIVQGERGKNQRQPGPLNRLLAEMAEVRIERLGAGH